MLILQKLRSFQSSDKTSVDSYHSSSSPSRPSIGTKTFLQSFFMSDENNMSCCTAIMGQNIVKLNWSPLGGLKGPSDESERLVQMHSVVSELLKIVTASSSYSSSLTAGMPLRTHPSVHSMDSSMINTTNTNNNNSSSSRDEKKLNALRALHELTISEYKDNR